MLQIQSLTQTHDGHVDFQISLEQIQAEQSTVSELFDWFLSCLC